MLMPHAYLRALARPYQLQRQLQSPRDDLPAQLHRELLLPHRLQLLAVSRQEAHQRDLLVRLSLTPPPPRTSGSVTKLSTTPRLPFTRPSDTDRFFSSITCAPGFSSSVPGA